MIARISHPQGTLARKVRFEGPGLHTGGLHYVVMHPAPAGHGIVFRQVGRHGVSTDIPADWRRTRELPLCTCLAGAGRAQVRTVEHLLAACYACGIDNTLVEVRGREIPIMDGSAAPLTELIAGAGVETQEQPSRRLVLRQTVEVRDGRRFIRIEPHRRLTLRIRTSTKGFGPMVWKGPMNRSVFSREIVGARTFGRLSHGLLARIFTGLARDPLCQGASMRTAIVISRGRVLNPGGLRYPDEFVRHRVLDLMGDLMLAGADLTGKITARSPVHSLNRRFIAAVFNSPDAWREDA